MKNLIIVFIAASFLVLTSCSKENIELPTEPETPEALITQQNVVGEAEFVTLRLQVTEVANTEVANSYLVDFAGNYDFSRVDVATNQTLKFTDSSGNISTLIFTVNGFAGSNGHLDMDFAKGTNVLTGLTLVSAQEIVIDDEIFN